jgi:hypothetical protein
MTSIPRMTGPEHYREAARLLEPGAYDEAEDAGLFARDMALAQVHATLAVAAATIEAAAKAWHEVLHGKQAAS